MAYFKKSYPLTLILLLGIFLFGVVYGLSAHKKQQEKLSAEQLRGEQAEKLAQKIRQKEELDELFKQYLGNFKSDLKKQAIIYKDNRKVLKEILSPYNFETPEYAKENYQLFKDQVVPSLRNNSEDIINIFQIYTSELEKELQDTENEIQREFFIKWTEMSQKQLNSYIDFFTKEEELIQAYEELITFYYVHSKRYSIDLENNVFIFGRKEDKNKETELLQKIKDLKKKK